MNEKHETSLDQQIGKLRKILEENPGDLSVLMVYAEANLRKGNRLEAMKAYQDVVRIKPDVPEVRIALAKIYVSMNHYVDAYQEILNVLKMDEKNLEGHLLLKTLSRKTPIPEEFSSELSNQLEFKASPRRVRTLQTQSSLEKRKYERLIKEYDKQLEDNNGDPVTLYNRKKAQERLEFAIQTFQDLEDMVGEPDEGEEQYYRPVPIRVVESVVPRQETAEEKPLDALATEDEISDEGPMLGHENIEVIEAIAEYLDEKVPDVDGSPEPLHTEEILPVVVDIAEIAEIPEPEESILDQMAQPDSITADQLFAEKFADNQEPVVIEIAEEIPSEETSAVSEVSAVEPESAIPEVSEERKKFYKDIHGKMDFVLSTLSKTRGVTSSFIMDKTGAILHIMSTENFDRMEMSQQALKGVEPLLEWRTSKEQTECELLYWVLEFKKGMMVLQPLTPEVFLVVLGKAGANFGAVRYSIEKNTGKLLSALAKMPA
jgi:predicted regulator of Ras-like GTPase activity (Roadblock/LC7/MglB family)